MEMFSPTAKLTAIHAIIAIGAHNDWELEQTDIDGAYLNAALQETIYMCQPKGYEVPGRNGTSSPSAGSLQSETGRVGVVPPLLRSHA